MNSISKLILLAVLVTVSGCASRGIYQSTEYYPVYPRSDTRIYSSYYSSRPAYRDYYAPAPVRIIERRTPVTVINKRVEVVRPVPKWQGPWDRNDRRYDRRRDGFDYSRKGDDKDRRRAEARNERREGSRSEQVIPQESSRREVPSYNRREGRVARAERSESQTIARNTQLNQSEPRQQEKRMERQERRMERREREGSNERGGRRE
ncbi:MAG: hypothetical protein KGZ88_21530 [Methylomicrobium sp.]|nr:hypothetical protein [Methylomicrobium sp.]